MGGFSYAWISWVCFVILFVYLSYCTYCHLKLLFIVLHCIKGLMASQAHYKTSSSKGIVWKYKHKYSIPLLVHAFSASVVAILIISL